MVDSRQSTVSVLPSVERIQQELARAKSTDDRLRARRASSPPGRLTYDDPAAELSKIPRLTLP